MIHPLLTESEKASMNNGTATAETLAKVQNIISDYLEQTRPLTFEEQFKKQQEFHREQRVLNINREMNYLQKQLDKLNDMADRDMPLPHGQRQKLRAEISKLKEELETIKPKETKKEQPVSENVQKVASDLGFDVDSFVDGFNSSQSDNEQ
jgi:chromosome segregation ATPase